MNTANLMPIHRMQCDGRRLLFHKMNAEGTDAKTCRSFVWTS